MYLQKISYENVLVSHNHKIADHDASDSAGFFGVRGVGEEGACACGGGGHGRYVISGNFGIFEILDLKLRPLYIIRKQDRPLTDPASSFRRQPGVKPA